jgi:hypothetical protein
LALAVYVLNTSVTGTTTGEPAAVNVTATLTGEFVTLSPVIVIVPV